MANYDWRCLACDHVNSKARLECLACDAPNRLSWAEVEKWRALANRVASTPTRRDIAWRSVAASTQHKLHKSRSATIGAVVPLAALVLHAVILNRLMSLGDLLIVLAIIFGASTVITIPFLIVLRKQFASLMAPVPGMADSEQFLLDQATAEQARAYVTFACVSEIASVGMVGLASLGLVATSLSVFS